MDSLIYPPFDYRVKREGGKLWIFDILRRRYLVLSPEEWVRQHVVHYLVEHLHYPVPLVAVEREISVCGRRQRFDILCFDRAMNPFLVVECKAPSVELTSLVFDQAFRYNVTLGAPYVMVTNGLAHRVVEVLPDRRWQSLPDIPPFRG